MRRAFGRGAAGLLCVLAVVSGERAFGQSEATSTSTEPPVSPGVEPAASAPAPEPAATPASQHSPPVAAAPPQEAAPAFASTDVASLDLDELLNSLSTIATKREQTLRNNPVSVTVIGADAIEGTSAFTLCDTMQFVQGMSCRRGAMRKAVVGARGLGSNFLSNRILLLKDGRPETDPWTGIFYPDETTPMVNVKQVEVIRGPGSSLYGSNAFSGVINLVTRRPEDVIQKGKSVGADVRVLGGQYGTYRAQTTVAGKTGDFGALLNYSGLRTDGPQLLSDPSRDIVDNNEWSRVHHVSGRATYPGLTLDVGYTQSELGRPGGKVFTTVGNCGRCHYTGSDTEAVESFNAAASVQRKVTPALQMFGEAYLNLKRRQVKLQNEITQQMQQSLGKRRRIGGEVRGIYSAESFTVTLGADLKVDAINNGNIFETLTPADLGVTTAGAFTDVELRPFQKWVAFVGVRYDHPIMSRELWRNPSSHLSPRLTVLHHLTDQLTFSGRYGHSFRAPAPAELAINQQMYGATLIGNPELRAESLDSFELVADYWPLRETLRLNVTAFYQSAKNLIKQEYLFGSVSRFQNIGSARVWGVESEISAVAPSIHSRLDLGYQFLRARAVGSSGTEALLDYAPEHRIFFRAHTRPLEKIFFDAYAMFVTNRQDPGFRTDGDGNVTGHMQLPAYLTASVRAGFNVMDGLAVSLFANNVFNAQYEESLGFPSPGMSLFGEIKFTY